MPRIICKDTNCQHNCCSQCLKEAIKVSKRAFCHSFDGKNDTVPQKKNEQFREEFAQENEVETYLKQSVSCDARTCVSNENGYCIKGMIEVRNKDFGAKCVSFMER